ncbi:MAG: type IV pilus secretin PilQ [Burkholderiaceae bacterium]|nr:type IV pilus secretin PilQ [Burkholderiaceae bacterium]
MRTWFQWSVRGLASFVLAASAAVLAIPVSAQDLPAIQSVTGSVQGGADVVRIDFSQSLAAVPQGFVVQSPARIALDFPGVTSGLAQSTVAVDQGNVKAAHVVQAGDRTRVVLNLGQPTTYHLELQGKSLLVALDPVKKTSVAAPSTQMFAESRNADTLPLRDIDFRRSTDNTGRIIIDLPNDQVGVDIRVQGKNVVVDLLKTSLPEGLRRRLDVSDFGTPVQTITTTQVGDRVHVVIEPKGAWEHSAYQSGNQLVVEVHQQRSDPNKLTSGPGYKGDKLSLNFQNIDVRSLLQVIADFTNFNVVTSDSVQGSVTLRLKDVPWDQALDIILQAKNLGMKRVGNVLQIAPKEEMAAKEKAEFQAKAEIQNLEPLQSESFQLNYTKAADVAAQLTSGGGSGGTGSSSNNAGRLLSSRGAVVAEPRTNQIFVYDIPSRLEQVREMIAKLDVPVRQVLIEARVVIASDTFGRSLGVKLGGSDLRGVKGGDAGYSASNGNRIAFGGSYDAVSAATGEGTTTGSTMNNTNTQFINMPAVGVNGISPANFAISLFNSAANRFLDLEISAIEGDGTGKTLASPRVVTADQTKAVIEQGTDYAYQQATSSGATAVSFRKASLKLEVTPQITPEGNIIMDLDITDDTPGGVVAGAMSINTKHVQTQVLIENGGTVVIGGIFTMDETDSVTKVPLLGDIPLLGNLFKQNAKTKNKQELLVFITPKVVADGGAIR